VFVKLRITSFPARPVKRLKMESALQFTVWNLFPSPPTLEYKAESGKDLVGFILRWHWALDQLHFSVNHPELVVQLGLQYDWKLGKLLLQNPETGKIFSDDEEETFFAKLGKLE
jgi:hypothetical protein